MVQNVQLFHFSLVFSSNSKTAFFSFLSLFLSFFPFFLDNLTSYQLSNIENGCGDLWEGGKETDPGCLI